MDASALRAELKMLGSRSLLLNVAAYGISAFLDGFTLRFALGLLLGTAVMLCNLLLLHRSLRQTIYEAKRTGKANAALQLRGYLLRMALFALSFAAALGFPHVLSPLAVALPPLYPKLLYTAAAVCSKSKSSGTSQL